MLILGHCVIADHAETDRLVFHIFHTSLAIYSRSFKSLSDAFSRLEPVPKRKKVHRSVTIRRSSNPWSETHGRMLRLSNCKTRIEGTSVFPRVNALIKPENRSDAIVQYDWVVLWIKLNHFPSSAAGKHLPALHFGEPPTS
jgi:hypothetical protein